jgi:all-trans-retinol 13,14-reductase
MLFTSFQHSKRTPEFSDSISVMCYLDIEAFDRWKETQRTIVDDSTRTADYYSFKQHCEQKVLKRVIERFPELDGRIKSIHSSSPLTYRDFLATPNGSMYGIQKDFNKIHHTQINTRTHLPNLYLTGQNVLFHGILGASLAGLLTSFHFLDKEQLINEING